MLSLQLTKVVALAAALIGTYVLFNPQTVQVFSASINLETINALLMIFVSVLVLVVASYSHRNLQGQPRLTRFGTLLTVALLGLLVMVSAGTLVQFALGWTLSGQATASLIAHANDPAARRAARYVRTWLSTSDVLVWLAVASLALPNSGLFTITWGSGSVFAASTAGLALVLASIVRTGLLPAHRWLAQTAEAPSPVSAFLHAGIINAAGISVALWLPIMRPWLALLLVSACATLIIGMLTMRNRADVKGQLASSTSMQMAFMSIEAAVGLPGLAVAHLIGHGSYKSWCFLRAGGAITRRRLGHIAHRPTWAIVITGVGIGVGTAAVIFALTQSLEPLTAVVGVIAAASVIVYAYNGDGRRWLPVIAVSTLGLAAYLVVAHLWLTWIPLPHWVDVPMLAVALVSLLIAGVVNRLLPAPTAQRLSWYLIAPRFMRVPSIAKTDLNWPTPEPARTPILEELVDTARGCVEPSWPLRTAVAVNPVSSLTNLPFALAADVANALGAKLYASPSQYLYLWESGAIDERHLTSLLGDSSTVAEFVERTRAQSTDDAVIAQSPATPAWELAHRWCQLTWRESDTPGDVFTNWHHSLPRTLAAQISTEPIVALAQALEVHQRIQPLNLEQNPTAQQLRVLHQLLTTAPGWAAHAQWRGREAVVQLLALRACITALYTEPLTLLASNDFAGSAIWQLALEDTFDDWLNNQLGAGSAGNEEQANIGVVTCIDVRSEPMRRALESAGGIRTYGAAGFFGVDAALHVNDCTIGLAPVIVAPSVTVESAIRSSWVADLTEGLTCTMEGLGGLAIAEGFGVAALGASLVNTFTPRLSPTLAHRIQPDVWLGTTGREVDHLSVDQQVAYARGFLDGLGGQNFPQLMVVAGHTADAANNAFAAAYQCGACGGNSGSVNARLITTMLNNPAVREHLIADGYGIEGTTFIAALHNTTSNMIELDPAAYLEGELANLAAELSSASRRAQLQLVHRPSSLPGAASTSRGMDWAQPFPEWGLVGNAACIIGPRELTAGADLQGRVFLHEYDWTSDPDGSLLNGILQGPGAVMHMINMQYYCSTVDQGSFGSLDKTRHNVVGDLGVLVGASGDLHYGLPWQSLGPDPDQLLHAPIRLRILVAAPPQQLEDALRGTAVERLAANGWLKIESLQPMEHDAVLIAHGASRDYRYTSRRWPIRTTRITRTSSTTS